MEAISLPCALRRVIGAPLAWKKARHLSCKVTSAIDPNESIAIGCFRGREIINFSYPALFTAGLAGFSVMY
jgi:hypothetical protein